MIQTMFTCWNFTMSGNGIIATTISTVDLVSAITTRSKGSEKGQKSGTNRWRRIYRISFLDLSSCPSGASHFTFEFIRTGHRNLLFDRSPSSPPPPLLFSNPGSTGPLLLPQRPRYFVVVSSSMPPFFVSCSPFVSFFDSLSLSSTSIPSSQFHLVVFPSYIFLRSSALLSNSTIFVFLSFYFTGTIMYAACNFVWNYRYYSCFTAFTATLLCIIVLQSSNLYRLILKNYR